MHIYTSKVMLLDNVLRDLIPCVCPLIKALKFLVRGALFCQKNVGEIKHLPDISENKCSKNFTDNANNKNKSDQYK
jgi:hypothetical protein